MSNRLLNRLKTAVEIGALAFNWAKTATAPESDGGEAITETEITALVESVGNIVLRNAGSDKTLRVNLETPPAEAHPAYGL